MACNNLLATGLLDASTTCFADNDIAVVQTVGMALTMGVIIACVVGVVLFYLSTKDRKMYD